MLLALRSFRVCRQCVFYVPFRTFTCTFINWFHHQQLYCHRPFQIQFQYQYQYQYQFQLRLLSDSTRINNRLTFHGDQWLHEHQTGKKDSVASAQNAEEQTPLRTLPEVENALAQVNKIANNKNNRNKARETTIRATYSALISEVRKRIEKTIEKDSVRSQAIQWEKDMEQLERIIQSFQKNAEIGPYDVSQAIVTFADAKYIEKAEKLYEKVVRTGKGIDVGVHNAMMKAQVENGRMEAALKIFEYMHHVPKDADKNPRKRKRILPDSYTYSTLINGFAKSSDIRRTLSLFELARSDKRIKMVPQIWTPVASVLALFGDVNEALTLIRRYPQGRKDIRAYNEIVKAAATNNNEAGVIKVLKLLNGMQDVGLTMHTVAGIVRGFAIAGQPLKSVDWFCKLVRGEYGHVKLSYLNYAWLLEALADNPLVARPIAFAAVEMCHRAHASDHKSYNLTPSIVDLHPFKHSELAMRLVLQHFMFDACFKTSILSGNIRQRVSEVLPSLDVVIRVPNDEHLDQEQLDEDMFTGAEVVVIDDENDEAPEEIQLPVTPGRKVVEGFFRNLYPNVLFRSTKIGYALDRKTLGLWIAINTHILVQNELIGLFNFAKFAEQLEQGLKSSEDLQKTVLQLSATARDKWNRHPTFEVPAAELQLLGLDSKRSSWLMWIKRKILEQYGLYTPAPRPQHATSFNIDPYASRSKVSVQARAET